MKSKYVLRVTAGPSYNPESHTEVVVNKPEPVKINHGLMDIELNVRIKDYTGLPRNSPETSPYFQTEPHAVNDDRYSICFRFTPKPPPQRSTTPVPPSRCESRSSSPSSRGRKTSFSGLARSLSRQSRTLSKSAGRRNSTSMSVPVTAMTGSTTVDQVTEPTADTARTNGILATDLQFGNDFAQPIRDRLPPGFNTALGIVKWWIDPGLDGDAYSDTPHLYGPALSSLNVIHVGEGDFDEDKGGLWFEEGGNDDGVEWRNNICAPDTGKDRMKWALRKESKEAWVWEWGRTYGADFFNPYLNFADFTLRLPGFSLAIMKYIDNDPQFYRSHHLRYVLRNKATGDTYMVIVFTLHRSEDVNENGTLKPVSAETETSSSDHAPPSGGINKGLVNIPEAPGLNPATRAIADSDDEDID